MSDLNTAQNERLASIKEHMNRNKIRIPLRGALRILNWYNQQIGNLVDKTFDAFAAEHTPEQMQSVAYDPMFDELTNRMPFRAGSTSQIDSPLQNDPQVQHQQRELSDGSPRLAPWEQIRPPSLTVNSNGIAYITHNDKAYIRDDLARLDQFKLLEIAEAQGVPVGRGDTAAAHSAFSMLNKLMKREEENYAHNK